MNFNTFSSLYGVSNATGSFSGSGYNSALVQAARNYSINLTIITGSSLGETLQITSSFGSVISSSIGYSTSSFNGATSSIQLPTDPRFQSVVINHSLIGSPTTNPNINNPIRINAPLQQTGSFTISCQNQSEGDRMFTIQGHECNDRIFYNYD